MMSESGIFRQDTNVIATRSAAIDLLQFNRDYYSHTAADQNLDRLIGEGNHPLWRRHVSGHAPAATRVVIVFKYYNRTWISIFN